MTDETIDTELHAYHGWPIRVICEFQVADGRFEARSFVTPAGQPERATPGGASTESEPGRAKALALKAARKYIDSVLID